MYITPDGKVGGGLPPLDKEKFEKQFKNSIISEEKGKYKFIKDYTTGVCIEYNSTGVNPCSKYKYITYKTGDIIDVETFWFSGSGGKEIQAKLPIKEENLGVPISFLQKVSDSTPIFSSNSTPKENSNLVKIALLGLVGFVIYKLVKK